MGKEARTNENTPDGLRLSAEDLGGSAVGRVLNSHQVADLFGVHYETVLRWYKNGQLPGAKIGGQWYSSERQLEMLFAPQSTDQSQVLGQGSEYSARRSLRATGTAAEASDI